MWELFAEITIRHCHKHNKRLQRQHQRGQVVSIGSGSSAGSGQGHDPADSAPPPDQILIAREAEEACRDLVEECERILAEQAMDPQRATRRLGVLAMHLNGTSRTDIARALNAAIPTIDRDLKEIRTVLKRLSEQEEEG
jgi:DNA-directed RNA polymerase specialized sigma24 family protein